MRSVGLAVEPTKGRPCLTLVAVDDVSGVPVAVRWVELTSPDVAVASQLATLHASLLTHLHSLLPLDVVVVRRAGTPPRPQALTDAGRLRVMAEGAALAAARDKVPDTRLAQGVDLARWRGIGRDDLELDAAAFVVAAGMSALVGERKRYATAAAAALAGLSAPPL